MDAKTELYGIIGNPVRHSLSPMIHNGAFKRLGWNAVYLAFEVKKIDEALKGVRGLGVKGVSVTIPFKTEVIPFLDKIEGMAKKIGAVNTIVNREGKLIGYNTDCDGALEALEEKMSLRGNGAPIIRPRSTTVTSSAASPCRKESMRRQSRPCTRMAF